MTAENGIFVPIIIGLIEIAKRAGLPSNLSPIVSLILGIAFSFASGFAGFETILNGLISGLAASGLYSGTKAVMGK